MVITFLQILVMLSYVVPPRLVLLHSPGGATGIIKGYLTLYYVSAVIFFIIEHGITRFLCAMQVFEVQASSSFHK